MVIVKFYINCIWMRGVPAFATFLRPKKSFRLPSHTFNAIETTRMIHRIAVIFTIPFCFYRNSRGIIMLMICAAMSIRLPPFLLAPFRYLLIFVHNYLLLINSEPVREYSLPVLHLPCGVLLLALARFGSLCIGGE